MKAPATFPAPTIGVRLDERAGGAVAYVRIENSAKLNALGSALMFSFVEQVEALGDREDMRAVVLTGAGDRAFIGGANIVEMAALDAAGAEAFITLVHRTCNCLRELPVPVIARINGYCLGAGMEIATSCDMRVASRNAKFGMPEVRFGLPSGMEACLLPRVIGWGKTMELIYTGEMIDAQEAYHFGFVEKLVDQKDLDAATESWVRAIVTAGPRAIRLQKELCRDWERMSIADAVQQGIRAVGRAHLTDEPRRLLTAFKNRKRNK